MTVKKKIENGLYYLADVDKEVFLINGKDGFIVASCPEIKGCHSQGKNLKEAIENIKDAIEACLETLKEEPISLTIEHPGFIEKRISFKATAFNYIS